MKIQKDLFEQAKEYAYDYMESASERKVVPEEHAIDRLDVFDEPLPEKPCDPSEIIHLLHEYGSPATIAQTGGRYFGFVNGGAIPAAVAAKWLADVWDQNSALYTMSPIASKLEAICEKWLINLLGLPNDTVAGFVSGTSLATICGLTAGRNEILNRLGWDVNIKGVFSAPKIRIVLGEQAHSSIFKALSLLGFGEEQVERVEVDDQGRIIVEKMPQLDDQTIVIVQAGNVSSGSFDSIDEICDRAIIAGSWVHVDGAFGLWSAASTIKKHLTKGIEKADSWSVDAHKTLNVPYDCGIIFCKNRNAFAKAMQAKGSYIQYSENRDGMLYTLEMSRRARSIELWAALKSLGKNGVAKLVDRLCDHALEFSRQLNDQGFNILNNVVFNQVLVACDTHDQTNATLANIQKSGECWCGGAVWNNEPVIRVSVCSWATTSEDINRSVRAFVEARKRAQSEIL